LIRKQALELLARLCLFGGIVVISIGVGMAVFGVPAPPFADGQISLPFVSTPTPRPTATPSPTPRPNFAVLAGHSPDNLDSGAVCPDGLREVDVNETVARQVVDRLRAEGYRVDLFTEFDPRLKRAELGQTPAYTADAFLAIHSDACVTGADYAYATGYKIAHADPSDVPEEDDRLVRCLTREYDRVVAPLSLHFHQASITRDMTAYHAFRQIDPRTPAAIIELGFLGYDRAVLTGHQDVLAAGLTRGLVAFLDGDACDESPTPTPSPTR
jgi:N-acetylmuramoyl-L-alanine amidase